MSVTTISGPVSHDPLEELLQKLEERVNGIVKELTLDATQFEQHEEPTTSALAYEIRRQLGNSPVEAPGLGASPTY